MTSITRRDKATRRKRQSFESALKASWTRVYTQCSSRGMDMSHNKGQGRKRKKQREINPRFRRDVYRPQCAPHFLFPSLATRNGTPRHQSPAVSAQDQKQFRERVGRRYHQWVSHCTCEGPASEPPTSRPSVLLAGTMENTDHRTSRVLGGCQERRGESSWSLRRYLQENALSASSCPDWTVPLRIVQRIDAFHRLGLGIERQ
jgi:hypothetical protein